MWMHINLLRILLVSGAPISRPIFIKFGMEIQFAKKKQGLSVM